MDVYKNMKTLQELVIGSAIFLVIDRAVRLISARIAARGDKSTRLASLHVEILTLVLVMFIAWKLLG